MSLALFNVVNALGELPWSPPEPTPHVRYRRSDAPSPNEEVQESEPSLIALLPIRESAVRAQVGMGGLIGQRFCKRNLNSCRTSTRATGATSRATSPMTSTLQLLNEALRLDRHGFNVRATEIRKNTNCSALVAKMKGHASACAD